MQRDEPNVNVTMYQDDAHNGHPLPENTGGTSDDRMDIANAIGADLGIPLGLALQIAERILLSEWRRESLAQAWDKGWDAHVNYKVAPYVWPTPKVRENPYL